MSKKMNKALGSALVVGASAVSLSWAAQDAIAALPSNVSLDSRGHVVLGKERANKALARVLSRAKVGIRESTVEELKDYWLANNGKCKGNGQCCCNPK